MSGLPKRQDADSSRRSIAVIGWVVALCVAALSVELVVAFAFSMYCDENLIPGTARKNVCDEAADWGYAMMLTLPPLAVLGSGAVAHLRGEVRFIWWTFAIAVGAGIAIPWTVRLIAGY
jgi:hypothetical protein